MEVLGRGPLHVLSGDGREAREMLLDGLRTEPSGQRVGIAPRARQLVVGVVDELRLDHAARALELVGGNAVLHNFGDGPVDLGLYRIEPSRVAGQRVDGNLASVAREPASWRPGLNRLADIERVVESTAEKKQFVVIQRGGLLGLGGKEMALPLESIAIQGDKAGLQHGRGQLDAGVQEREQRLSRARRRSAGKRSSVSCSEE